MARRDFLAVSSVATLSAALAPSNSLMSWADAVSPSFPVSIGYWSGSDALLGQSPGQEDLPSTLIAAETLSAGDPNFAARNARIDFRGMYPLDTSQVLQERKILSINIHYRPYHDVAFPVLCFENSEVPNFGLAKDLTVPIDAATGLLLTVEQAARPTELNPEPLTELVTLQFSLGQKPGALKLCRGVYFIAFLGSASDPLPDWSACKLQHQGDSRLDDNPFELSIQGTTDSPVPFDYVVLQVDYSNEVQQGTTPNWLVH